MAINKIDKPKTEWTATSLILLSVSLVLGLVSVALGWFAYVNWRFEANLAEGLREFAQGRPGVARMSLKSALEYRSIDIPSRELLAKIECDEGNLSEAAKQYKILRLQGHRSPTVPVGLGVVALREACKLEDPKAVAAKVREAVEEFTKANGLVPEADLGLAHSELILAWKFNETARAAKAKGFFEKIRATMDGKPEYRGAVTRDGLVDYYSGLGKVLASGDGYDPAATAAYRACHQYARRWLQPLSNVLIVEARRMLAIPGDKDALAVLKPSLTALKNEGSNLIRSNREAKEALGEAWFQYGLALAGAWGRAGVLPEAQPILRDLASTAGYEGRLEPGLMEALIRTELAMKDDPNGANQERSISSAVQGYGEFVQKIGNDDARKEIRVWALNNLAWMQAWRGGYSSNVSYHTQALDRLTEALKLLPDDALLNRNICIVLKRLKRPPAAWQANLEKVKAGSSSTGAQDLDALSKYLESN